MLVAVGVTCAEGVRCCLESNHAVAHQNKSSKTIWADCAVHKLAVVKQRQADLLNTEKVEEKAHKSGWFWEKTKIVVGSL